VIPELSWLDWTLLAVLAVSVLVGLVRGFVFECLSLAGWVVAWFAAQWGSPWLAPYVPVGAEGSSLRMGVTFAAAFILALIVWALLARLVRMLIHATPLSVADRLLGGGFGALRGVVLLLAVATVVALTPASQSPGWRASQGARWLSLTLAGLKPLLPEPVARLVRV
jgi:membrane protein required for colicin V production